MKLHRLTERGLQSQYRMSTNSTTFCLSGGPWARMKEKKVHGTWYHEIGQVAR